MNTGDLHKEKKPPRGYIEDDFDLQKREREASAKIRENAFLQRTRRQISVGKVIIAVVALIISVALYYVISVVL